MDRGGSPRCRHRSHGSTAEVSRRVVGAGRGDRAGVPRFLPAHPGRPDNRDALAPHHGDRPMSQPISPGPIRLHHHATVTDDQEATRRFYEDVIGMPLVATWTESDVLFGATRTYCHTFYALADGSR